MPSFQRHVFVCVNERPPDHPRGCCKARGGDAVRDRFKKQLTASGIKDAVRANKSGCLDQCDSGVTVLVYPEQVWYGHVTPDDVAEIVERHILGGEFVERLMLPDQPHLGGARSAPPMDPALVRPVRRPAAAPSPEAGDDDEP